MALLATTDQFYPHETLRILLLTMQTGDARQILNVDTCFVGNRIELLSIYTVNERETHEAFVNFIICEFYSHEILWNGIRKCGQLYF